MIKKIICAIKKRFQEPTDYARSIGVKVGEGCKFNGMPNFGSEPWLVQIGNHVELSGDVTFVEHDGATWVFRNDEDFKHVIKYGKIIIHDNCFIGIGTTILPGVEIGPNSIIGAGSLVNKTVPHGSVWGGVPAHFICTLDTYKKKALESTPEYDIDAYKKDKKSVVSELLSDRLRI